MYENILEAGSFAHEIWFLSVSGLRLGHQVASFPPYLLFFWVKSRLNLLPPRYSLMLSCQLCQRCHFCVYIRDFSWMWTCACLLVLGWLANERVSVSAPDQISARHPDVCFSLAALAVCFQIVKEGDTNQDGVLDLDEFTQYLHAHEKKLKIMFRSLDRNKDGQ